MQLGVEKLHVFFLIKALKFITIITLLCFKIIDTKQLSRWGGKRESKAVAFGSTLEATVVFILKFQVPTNQITIILKFDNYLADLIYLKE